MLGQPEKRLQYDRDVLRTAHSGNSSPRGSFYSSGPVGGRPASGLSRRRTHFKGPPPSFYRSGGWGNQGAKRQRAHSEGSSTAYMGADGAFQSSTAGGMGPGQQPFGPSSNVPHFDREGHFRTHMNNENRRRRRMSDAYIPNEPGSGVWANFLLVSTIVSVGILLPSFLFERMTRKNRSDK